MGCTLAELNARMTRAEFALHLQRELQRHPQQADVDELVWQGD